MNSHNKAFDEELHSKYDMLGKWWAYKLFKRYGLRLLENIDKYAVDMIAYKDDIKVGYVEVEVREAWVGEFKWDSLNIPARKKKLLTNDFPTRLVAFNKNGSHCFICHDVEILNSPLEEVKNKYIPEGEMFFKVPLDKIKLVSSK